MAEILPYGLAGERVIVAPSAGYTGGEMLQLPDGRACYVDGLNSFDSGDPVNLKTEGLVEVAKTSGVVVLDGAPMYWDRSAGTATPLQAFDGTGDFFIGCAVKDAASTATSCWVDLNIQPRPLVDLWTSAWETIVVLTSGTPDLKMRGGTAVLAFSATAEAQKVDLLSKDSFPTSGWILDMLVAIYDIGDNAAADFNFGVANATHATDADAITESVFFHLDGTALDIKAESDDGTVEVAATDTTVNAVDDTYFLATIDARDNTDIQLYLNAVNVLPASVFKLNSATGPMKVLAHIEKTSNDTAGDLRVAKAQLRMMDHTTGL